MALLVQLLHLIRDLTADRNRLTLENAALRHQLAVLKRTVKRPHIKDSDRIFWIMMRRLLQDVIRWHRKGWKYYWKRKSRSRRLGRPPIGRKLIELIRRLSRDNPLWGARRTSTTSWRSLAMTWPSPRWPGTWCVPRIRSVNRPGAPFSGTTWT